jgi:septum formation protein
VTPSLVLASASPRRSAILRTLGLEHEVLAADVPESFRPGETPEFHVERLARDKAMAARRSRPDALVLGGDTVVVVEGEVLGKPSDAGEATATLLRLSGRSHTVFSGLALAVPGGAVHSVVEQARVAFRSFDREAAEAYVETGEPLDKAGAYGIQGMGAAFVARIEGDYYTVVGLPVGGLLSLLERAGWRYAFGGGLRPAQTETE